MQAVGLQVERGKRQLVATGLYRVPKSAPGKSPGPLCLLFLDACAIAWIAFAIGAEAATLHGLHRNLLTLSLGAVGRYRVKDQL